MKSEITKEGSPKKKYRLYIFAAFLAVIMALSCVAIFAADSEDVAAEGNVAKIGTTEYATLADAVAAATGGDKIVLINDVSLTSTVAFDKELTLDLAGYNITATDVRAILVKAGSLDIIGEGTISAGGNIVDSSSVIRIGDNTGDARDVSLTIGENVTVSTDKCYGITIFGNKTTETLTINGTVATTAVPAISGNGSTGYGNTTITIGETAVISTVDEYAIYHPQSGTLTINGSVTGKGGVELKAGATNVQVNGEITATATSQSHSKNNDGTSTSGYAIAVVENSGYAGGATVTVPAGTVNGVIIIVADDAVPEEKKGSITLSGGSYSVQPDAAYVASGYFVNADAAGTFSVHADADAVATVNDVKYATLADAVAAANAEDTIIIVADCAYDRVFISKSLIVNFNGKTLTGRLTIDNGTVMLKSGTISGRLDVYDSSSVTIAADMTVTNDTGDAAVVVWGDGVYGQAGVKTPVLNVFGTVTFTAENPAITTNGTDTSRPVINICDTAVVTSADIAIYQPSGILTISGGSITGATAVYFKATSITITGGTLTGNGAAADYQYNGNGAYPTGDALVIDSCNYPAGIDTVSVSGGEFISQNAKPVGSYKYGEATLQTGFITGGIYDKAPVAECIADGKVAVLNTTTNKYEIVDVFTVSVAVGIQNGTVTAAPLSGAEGTEITLTITPDEGYQLKEGSLVVTGTGGNVTVTNNKFAMPAYDVTVTAEFELVSYDVAYNITNAQPVVGGKVNYHAAFESVTITPNEHYVVPASVTVTMDGAAFTNFTYENGKVTIAADLIEGDIEITGECARQTYAITLAVDGEGSGTIDPTSIGAQAYGTDYSVADNVLTIGETAITATPAADTAQYTYAFEGWYIGENKITAASTITGATTFTAKFTKTVKCYSLEINSSEGSYGSVKLDTEAAGPSVVIANIPYNAEISIQNDSLSVTDKDSVTHVVMAIAEDASAQWQYSFDGFDKETGTKITGNMTVVAEFSRSAREYNVNIGTLTNGTIAADPTSGAEGTEITLTITPADGYQLKAGTLSVSGTAGAVTVTDNKFSMPASDVSVTAEFELVPVATYDVTIVVNDTAFGTVDVSAIDDVPADSIISVSGSTMTINGTTVTATPTAETAQYKYAFASWSVNDGDKVTSNLEITATFTQEVRQYSITLDLGIGGKLATTPEGFEKVSDVAYIGWFDYGTDANVTEVPTKDATAEYTYEFDKWNVPFPIHVTESTMTVALYKEMPREYTVTFGVAGNGTVDVTSVSVPYGSAFAVDGDKVTINGTTVTVTVGADTEKYTYTLEGWNVKNGDTVAGDTAVAAIVTEFTKPATSETAVEFISDSDDVTVTASVDDIKASDKDNVVIGKDSADDKWSVEIPKTYFSDKTDSVSVTVTDVSDDLPSTITLDQKEKLEGMTVIALDMVIGDKTEHQFGSKVTVKLAYTLKAGESADNLFVYYVNTDTGALDKYEATYADGFVSFETDHFSYWAVGGDIDNKSSFANDGLFLAALLVAAIVAPIIVALVYFRKH